MWPGTTTTTACWGGGGAASALAKGTIVAALSATAATRAVNMEERLIIRSPLDESKSGSHVIGDMLGYGCLN